MTTDNVVSFDVCRRFRVCELASTSSYSSPHVFFVFTTTTECHKSTVGFQNAYETAVFSSKYVSHFVYIFGVFLIVLIALVPYYSAAE